MSYQLVLQWPTSSKADYDSLLEIEERLVNELGGEHEVDGHDFGSGEMNIFIATKGPEEAFKEVKRLVGGTMLGRQMRAAFREEAGDEYTILWPKGLKTFSVS